MANSSTVPGSMTGSGNVQADTVEPGGPGGPLGKGIALAGGGWLTQGAVVTGAHSAVAGELVRADISGGSLTVTLPGAPAAGTLAAVKVVASAAGNVNACTIACSGADVLNRAGGPASMTLTLQGQGALLQYGPGIWVIVATDDAAAQLATTRQGVFYLDSYTGTDDVKMASALAAVVAAGGGTIQLSARVHAFASQWSTSWVSASSNLQVRITGAGSSPTGITNVSAGGVTKCVMSYSGSGAGQTDFQHNGLIEISHIWFSDTTGSVPFFFCTNATPWIHDCAFTGSGPATACIKDAIVLGGQGAASQGAGDTVKYDGYQGWIARNFFDTIRQWVVFGGGANGIVVRENFGNELCGMAGNWSAPFRFQGNSLHGNSGNIIRDNYIPLGTGGVAYYQCVFNGLGGYANHCHMGPNTIWDGSPGGEVYAVLDSTCASNFVDDTTYRTSSSTTPVYSSETQQTSVLSVNTPSVMASTPLVMAADFVYRYQGFGPKAEYYSGDRAWWVAVPNNSLVTASGAAVNIAPGTRVSDGNIITGSGVVTSVTAAFASSDVGAFIDTPLSAGIPGNTYIRWIVTPSSPGFAWAASTAYAAGQVVTPVTANGHLYQCTTAGTSGSAQPAWITTGPPNTQADGTVTWEDLGTTATAAILSQNATVTSPAATVAFGRQGSPSSMTKFVNHHIIGSGTAPSYVVVVAGAGTGATVSVTGNDLGHVVTLTPAGTPAAGKICTGTPGNSFSGAGQSGAFAITPQTAPAAALGLYGTFAGNTWNIYATNAPLVGSSYIFMVNTLG